MTETASSSDTSNKDECLDFRAPYNAAQYLNFQDPSCNCYDQPECWLPWSENQTETSGGSFSGFVYRRARLSSAFVLLITAISFQIQTIVLWRTTINRNKIIFILDTLAFSNLSIFTRICLIPLLTLPRIKKKKL
jgi:hypothetical protein